MVSIDDCGLMLEPQQGMTVQDVVDWAIIAEQRNFGYILRSDHLLPIWDSKDRDSPECWSSLGVLAATTKKIKFGPLVSPIGFRNPAALARMACNLNDYSHGRLLLGVGAGWYEEEYHAFGYEFPNFRIRYDQFIESLKIIKPLIEGKPVDFHGKYYSAKAHCYPRTKVPLIIGGRKPRMMRVIADYADEWNIYNPRIADLQELKSAVDKNKGDRNIQVSRMGPFVIAETRDQLERKIAKNAELYKARFESSLKPDEIRKNGGLCGTVDEFTSQLNGFAEAGVEKFYFQILDTEDKEMVDLLANTLKN
jgi:alkanesulfonate monooxygenase SsuD/methylene tetrahydromethanopterin reductase-like flavin-dependent oxidoreductase (luciferase family)